jgi:tRNA(fMet)-specific endonuclease VapC
MALILAIDTNRYRDLRDRLPEVVQALETATTIYVPFVVLAELKVGFGQGKRRVENERLLDAFLRQPGVEIAFPDSTTVDVYSALFLDLKTRGRPVPLNDLWIAALCVQHGWMLYTRDKHFDHLPQVARV